MDVIFDIDGTLANASHRLHFIKDMKFWVPSGITRNLKPDWDTFLSDEQVAKDTPIPQTWALMERMINRGDRIIFITGRKEASRDMTWRWLTDMSCEHRMHCATYLDLNYARLYMRRDGDRRSSSEVKRELLHRARDHGFNPTLVFEDRKDDTAMWRSEGLLCCQVAEGDY